MPTDEDKTMGDLTPYDLAARLVSGMQVTDAGVKEVAAELLRLKAIYDRAHNLAGTLAAVLEWDVA